MRSCHQVSVDEDDREDDDPDEEGEVDGLVRHGPRAEGPKETDGRDQANDPDDVENEPDEDPDSLSFEVALIVRFLVLVILTFRANKLYRFA